MPSRASTSLLPDTKVSAEQTGPSVSMPSRASTSLLHDIALAQWLCENMCQCPHGLVPHCYAGYDTAMAVVYVTCQCPHGLVPHCYCDKRDMLDELSQRVNALTG